MHSILITACSAILALTATAMVLRYARSRLIDQVTARSSHSCPTPRGGGLGLIFALLATWLASSALDGALPPAAAAIAAIAALGWWDDHADLPARLRLALQFLLAGAALWCVGITQQASLGGFALSAQPWLAGAIAVVGTVWLVNLYNFMDGIDGIAAGQGVVAAIASALLLRQAGADLGWISLAWATAGACLGFLWWNRPTARIFMGDVGSTALGLVFATLVVAQVRAGIGLDLALLPLSPFILDATCTLARRAWRRERLTQAHRSHLYQRLARYWGGHLPVTMLYSGLATLGAATALLSQHGLAPAWSAVSSIVVIFAALAWYGRRVQPV